MEETVIGQKRDGDVSRLVQNDGLRVFPSDAPVLVTGSGVQALLDAGHVREVDNDTERSQPTEGAESVVVAEATTPVPGVVQASSDVEPEATPGGGVRPAGRSGGQSAAQQN